MAVKSRKSKAWQTLHFLVRFLGLTGLVAACAGWFIWTVLGDEWLGTIVLSASAAAVALALLFEVGPIAQAAASRRGVFGFNAFLQIALIVALVVGGNIYSFETFKRFDLTRERIFTLDDKITKQLAQMRDDTEIIVLQQYVSFGQRSEHKQDKYDFAAQRKIIEKVKDLAEQFSEVGPRFRVTVLDVQEDNYQTKLDDIVNPKSLQNAIAEATDAKKKKGLEEILSARKDLGKAIENAPENSIFFFSPAHKQIQRLTFSDIYELDKQGSMKTKNLVLKFQGVEPFARKIFNIEEKKPRIALAVTHPLLGFENHRAPEYTMNGAKKALDAHGFECTDLMLRKLERGWPQTEPIVLSHDESRYEQIEDILANIDKSTKQLQKELDARAEHYKYWKDSSLATLNTKYIYARLLNGQQGVMLRSGVDNLKKTGLVRELVDVDEDDRRNETAPYLVLKDVLDNQLEERENMVKEKASLRAEDLREKRRLTDIESKAKKMLANIDLLILPRVTLRNIPADETVPNPIHYLDTSHLKAVKAFLKEGKPILFLLGPTNEDPESPSDPSPPDQLEPMLAELGFYLPKQTILYNMEARDYNESKFGGAFGKSKSEFEVPGLKFDSTTETGLRAKIKQQWSPHSIRTSLKVMNRTTTGKGGNEVRVRHPRPVYHLRPPLSPDAATGLVGGLALPGIAGVGQTSAAWLSSYKQKNDESAVFLATGGNSWNEENPFIVDNKIPRFAPTKDTDPKKNTIDEERQGPFPIGAAIETPLPPSWFGKEEAQPKQVRIAVIGSGGVFAGPALPPLKEKMLLDVVNWLIGRDDLLAKDAETWTYPRVAMKPGSVEFNLWQWGARLGLPLVFVYLGTVVWMVRRMR